MLPGIVCVAYVLLIVLMVYPTWKTNTKSENIFSVVCIVISFTVLLLRSMDINLPDPTSHLLDLLRSIGLAH